MSARKTALIASLEELGRRCLKGGLVSLFALTGLVLMGAAAPSSAVKFKAVDNGQANTSTFIMTGPINSGDLVKLQKKVADVPAGNRIVLMLSSPGGNSSEGLAIGRFVHSRLISTVAIQGTGCHSACTHIFVAGRDGETAQPSRIMMTGAKVGFHQVSYSGLPETITRSEADKLQTIIQDHVAQLNRYYKELGLEPEFLELALSAASNDITLLSEFQALRLGIYVMDAHTGKLMSPEGSRLQAAKR